MILRGRSFGFFRRRKCAGLVLVFLFCAGIFGFAAEEPWREVKSEHFIVYYFDDAPFAREVSLRAEKYYRQIASDLGYSRYDNFWQWESRAKIYIYRDQQEFRQVTGALAWVHGTAFYDKRTIVSYKWGTDFLDVLLPHELAHLIFRDFVGFKGEVPLWLDEGVAQWEETRRREEIFDAGRNLILSKQYIPLIKLTKLDQRSAAGPVITSKLYVQAATLVGFMIEKYGPTKFITFCRQLRDGHNIDESLSFAFTGSIRNLEELEKKWVQYYGGT